MENGTDMTNNYTREDLPNLFSHIDNNIIIMQPIGYRNPDMIRFRSLRGYYFIIGDTLEYNNNKYFVHTINHNHIDGDIITLYNTLYHPSPTGPALTRSIGIDPAERRLTIEQAANSIIAPEPYPPLYYELDITSQTYGGCHKCISFSNRFPDYISTDEITGRSFIKPYYGSDLDTSKKAFLKVMKAFLDHCDKEHMGDRGTRGRKQGPILWPRTPTQTQNTS